MAKTPTPDNDSKFSSRLTRRLAQEAENIFVGDDPTSKSLDEQFEELSKAAQSTVSENKQLTEDLVRLASLIDESGVRIGIDSSFRLSVSEDKMSTTLTITPAIGTGQQVTTKDVLDELKARNIMRGVLTRAIRQAIDDTEQGIDVRDRVVVRGTPPIPGVNPWVVYFGRHPGDELEEVDEAVLRQGADEAVLCEQGDTIAYIRQGDSGRPGYTAAGEDLQPKTPANSIKLKAGRNVIDMGGCYISEAEGAILLKDGYLSVQPTLIYNRDLDTNDSPLKFDGSIYVHGGVKSDVIIEATEDIIIDRVVEGAHITSTTGNIVLQAGIAGRNKGRISAAKEVTCGFVENASVIAGVDITLHVGALNSQLTANRDIIAETGRGGIVGGVVMAGRCIRAKRIGSYGTQTIVMAGICTDSIPALEKLNHKAIALQDRLTETVGLITQFDRAVRDPRALSPHEQKLYINLHKFRLVTDQELNLLQEYRREALAEANTDLDGSVLIHQKLEANVTFHIGSLVYAHRISKGPLKITSDAAHKKIICRGR